LISFPPVRVCRICLTSSGIGKRVRFLLLRPFARHFSFSLLGSTITTGSFDRQLFPLRKRESLRPYFFLCDVSAIKITAPSSSNRPPQPSKKVPPSPNYFGWSLSLSFRKHQAMRPLSSPPTKFLFAIFFFPARHNVFSGPFFLSSRHWKPGDISFQRKKLPGPRIHSLPFFSQHKFSLGHRPCLGGCPVPPTGRDLGACS